MVLIHTFYEKKCNTSDVNLICFTLIEREKSHVNSMNLNDKWSADAQNIIIYSYI